MEKHLLCITNLDSSVLMKPMSDSYPRHSLKNVPVRPNSFPYPQARHSTCTCSKRSGHRVLPRKFCERHRDRQQFFSRFLLEECRQIDISFEVMMGFASCRKKAHWRTVRIRSSCCVSTCLSILEISIPCYGREITTKSNRCFRHMRLWIIVLKRSTT